MLDARCLIWALALVLVAGPARCGAWTEPAGAWQIIASFDAARAAKGYDGLGRPDAPIRFDKLYQKDLVEYGWTPWLTLFAAPEFVVADSRWKREASVHARDVAIEAGARVRLTQAFGIVSVQASFKTAGAFDLSNSIGRASARIGELRLLDGSNFKLFHRDGFLDFEVAQRWVSHPRPNETVADTTAGLWVLPGTMLMFQNFNVISGGDAEPPYTFYRTHKMELSLVQHLSPNWCVQVGAFTTPGGQNALVEQGVTASVWANL